MTYPSIVKTVAAVHDLSGCGRTSLSVVVPILSTMGVKVFPLPTAVLSAHSQYEGFYFTDLTDHMRPIIDHWKRLYLTFSALYSGFLGSHAQIEIVREMIDSFVEDRQFVVVDPVLGDNGKRYTPIDQKMVEAMKSLVTRADVITPNLTEASLLLEKPFPESIELEEMKEWIFRLSELGPEIVVITSVPLRTETQGYCVLAYEKRGSRFWKIPIDYIAADFPGTGDCFTSILTGALLQGDSLPIALDRAVHFISFGVRATFGYSYDQRQGILLEKVLGQLQNPMPLSCYEIL